MKRFGKFSDDQILQWAALALASIIFIYASPFPRMSSYGLIVLGIIFSAKKTSLWRSILCGAIFFGFLGFSAFSGMRYRDISSPSPVNYYSQLTGNLLQGKLYLPWEPSQKLLELKNPYDPAQRNGVDFNWDLSLYKGKYYLYWGVAPAISFVAPFFFLTAHYPQEVTIALWFAMWGALFSFLLLMRILQTVQQAPATGFQKYMGALLVLFSLPYGALLRRPHIYEQALFSAHAYAMASLFCFYVFSERRRFSRANIFGNVAAGVLYGLTLMSRPTYALMFPAFFILSYFTNALEVRRQCKYFLMGAFPLVVIILAYNDLRFESPFEFGFFYQLNHIDMSKWGFSFTDSAYAIFGYLFQWPKFSADFPYAHFQHVGENWIAYGHRYMSDEVIGLFCAAPFAVLLFWDRKRIWSGSRMGFPIALIAIGFLILIVNATAGINVRYEMDFLPFFVLPASVWALFAWERSRSMVKSVVLILFFLYTIQLGFFTSFALELGPFAEANPQGLEQAKNWLEDSEETGNPSHHTSPDYLLLGTACVPARPLPTAWLIQLQRRSP